MKQKMNHGILVIILIAIDQFTKLWARNQFMDGSSFVIFPKVLRFLYHENTGAVWGIMSNQTVFLSILTGAALIVMFWIYHRTPKTKHYAPLLYILLFVAAGAVGNLIDRVIFGYVTDFIYFELIDFPVFNVADCYITVSVILFAILGLLFYKEDDYNCYQIRRKKQSQED